jgi:RHS repeat-associated protein
MIKRYFLQNKFLLLDVLKNTTLPYYTSIYKDLHLANSPYSFGFNGKEKTDEVSGVGNDYDYGFRIYNPRLGKFLSVDPLTQSFPQLTPYQFASNTPIWAIDLDGLEAKIYQTTLKDNWGFKAMMAIADQTTLGKEFNKVLKSQN